MAAVPSRSPAKPMKSWSAFAAAPRPTCSRSARSACVSTNPASGSALRWSVVSPAPMAPPATRSRARSIRRSVDFRGRFSQYVDQLDFECRPLTSNGKLTGTGALPRRGGPEHRHRAGSVALRLRQSGLRALWAFGKLDGQLWPAVPPGDRDRRQHAAEPRESRQPVDAGGRGCRTDRQCVGCGRQYAHASAPSACPPDSP